jgi:hypothetical protein
MKRCNTCGKDLCRQNKTGYCRSCVNKTEKSRKKNSVAVKKAHGDKRESYLHKGVNYGVASQTWRDANKEQYLQSIAKGVETTKNRIATGEIIPHKRGKRLSELERDSLSKKRIAFLESNPSHGLLWYTVNGIKVQGTWERDFALYLTKEGIKWSRVPVQYLNTRRYTPDFYCNDFDIYFEVKGFMRDRDIFKMYLVLDEHPAMKIKMIRKEELKNINSIDIFSLPNFQDIYKRSDIDMTKFINVWNR